MHTAMRILRDEHRSIAAVLQALQHLARDAVGPGVRPGFEVFRAMIHYIDAFPERLHHPKEDQYLFARLESRAPQARALLDELRAEHLEGAHRVRSLERSLELFETSWPQQGSQFLEAVNGYAEFHWSHMGKEEKQVLPLAERVLTAEDWRAIAEAFSGNEDPIADLREQDFERLYARIVSLAPAPVGLGERWQKAG